MDTDVKKKLEHFFGKYRKLDFSKGQPLMVADEDPGGIFYLTEGIVKEFVVNIEGMETILNVYKENSFFPTGWAISRKVQSHYFEAMTDVQTWKAPADDFLAFLKSEPDVLFDLLRRIYIGMDGMWLRLEYSMSGSAYQKFVTELLIFARRFGRNEDNRILIGFKFLEKDLAAQTGIARETVSRLIKKLKDKKIIGFKDNYITILDMEKLEGELIK